MWRLRCCLTVVVCLLPFCPRAFSMGGDYGKDLVHVPQNPPLERLANRDNRVHGDWLNFRDWFYFCGDARSLNGFLADFASLKDQPCVLVIHAGVPRGRRFSFDWRMDWARVVRGGSQVTFPVVDKVHVWLGGKVKLEELKVPGKIEVKSGGEIEKFIQEHNKRVGRKDRVAEDTPERVRRKGRPK